MNIPDNKRAKGRPKGSLNKRTKLFLQVLEERNFCPASAMIDCYELAIDAFNNADDKEAPSYLSTASQLACNISQYAYPKLKATESKKDPFEGMTSREILDVLKNAQVALELRIKEEEKPSG